MINFVVRNDNWSRHYSSRDDDEQWLADNLYIDKLSRQKAKREYELKTKHEVITYRNLHNKRFYNYQKIGKKWIVTKSSDESKVFEFKSKKALLEKFPSFDFTVYVKPWEMPKNIPEMTFDSVNSFILFYKKTLESYLDHLSVGVDPCKVICKSIKVISRDIPKSYPTNDHEFTSKLNNEEIKDLDTNDQFEHNSDKLENVSHLLSVTNLKLAPSTTDFFISKNSILGDPYESDPDDGHFLSDSDYRSNQSLDNFIKNFNQDFIKKSSSNRKFPKAKYSGWRGDCSSDISLSMFISDSCIPSVSKILSEIVKLNKMSDDYHRDFNERTAKESKVITESKTNYKLLTIQQTKINNRIDELQEMMNELSRNRRDLNNKIDEIERTDQNEHYDSKIHLRDKRLDNISNMLSDRVITLDSNFEEES